MLWGRRVLLVIKHLAQLLQFGLGLTQLLTQGRGCLRWTARWCGLYLSYDLRNILLGTVQLNGQ